MVKKETLNRIWKDPVWSKVIAGVILGILATLYVLIKAWYDKVPFQQGLLDFYNLIRAYTPVNNLILFLLLVNFGFFLYYFLRRIFSIKRKQDIEEIKPPAQYPTFNSDVMFDYQLARAFPGQRGTEWYTGKIAVDRLMIFFDTQLTFELSTDNFSPTPFWWFRDSSSMYISKVKRLSKTKMLIDHTEYEINRIAVHKDATYWKSFIYVEVYPEKQTGVHNISKEQIAESVKTFGYSWEEYALLNNRPIKRIEYDDGAAIVKNKVVAAFDAELRIRYLTSYNFILASHNCPYNSNKFVNQTGKLFNDILNGKFPPENLFNYLLTYKRNEP